MKVQTDLHQSFLNWQPQTSGWWYCHLLKSSYLCNNVTNSTEQIRRPFFPIGSFCFCVSKLWMQQVITSTLCHKVIFCILNKMTGNLCGRKCWGDIFCEGVWIPEGRKKDKWLSVYFGSCLLVCLVLSKQHLLLGRRCYQPSTSWLCKAPAAFPDGEQLIYLWSSCSVCASEFKASL